MIPNSKKIQNSKEQNNNLLINNDNYTKNFVDVDLNLKKNKQLGSVKTKYKMPSKASKPIIPPFNNNHSKSKIENENTQKNKNKINNISNPKIKNCLKKKQNSSNLLNEIKKDINNENKYEIFNSDISIISSSISKNNTSQKD